jgi:hypothetical protein
MGKARMAMAAVVASGLVGVPAMVLAATPAHADPSIINVCLTVTPKAISVTINGVPLIGQGAGVPTTCIGV